MITTALLCKKGPASQAGLFHKACSVVKEAATNWSGHKDARQGAALAYYSVFSLGPIIVIAIAVAGLLFGHDAVSSQVMSSIKEMLGDTGGKAVEAMLAGASRASRRLCDTAPARVF